MQASHPPYNAPKECAEPAQQIFDNMLKEGIHPTNWHFHALMDCQACAVHMLQLLTWRHGM